MECNISSSRWNSKEIGFSCEFGKNYQEWDKILDSLAEKY